MRTCVWPHPLVLHMYIATQYVSCDIDSIYHGLHMVLACMYMYSHGHTHYLRQYLLNREHSFTYLGIIWQFPNTLSCTLLTLSNTFRETYPHEFITEQSYPFLWRGVFVKSACVGSMVSAQL